MRLTLSLLSVCLAALSLVAAAPQNDEDTGDVVFEDNDGLSTGIMLAEGAAEGLYEYNTTSSVPKFTALSALGVVISRDLPPVEREPGLSGRANSVTHCFSATYSISRADEAVKALGNIIADRGGYIHQSSFAVVVGNAVQYVCNRQAPKNLYYDWYFPEQKSKDLDGLCGRPKAARWDRNDGACCIEFRDGQAVLQLLNARVGVECH